jgi:hypothetical protein
MFRWCPRLEKSGATFILLLVFGSLLILFTASFAVSVRASSGGSQTYGGTDADGTTSLIQTSDGGYILAGSTKSFGAGDFDSWLIKTDGAGNMQWNQTYGGRGTDIAASLVVTSDGGYAIAGYTYSISAVNSDLWLIKTDEQGVIPEFPSWIILPLFLFITLCAVATKKKTFYQLANTRT